mgnify:CR=1 FL=1
MFNVLINTSIKNTTTTAQHGTIISMHKLVSNATKTPAPSNKKGFADTYGNKSPSKQLWSKLKLSTKFLHVNKTGYRNALYKIAVYGASETGKTLFCSRMVGCSALSTSNSTDADDYRQHTLQHTLYDEHQHQVVVSDQLLEEDDVVTVIHQDHPRQTIGVELSNGKTVNVGQATAERLSMQAEPHVPSPSRTSVNTYVTQINIKTHVGLKHLIMMKYQNEQNQHHAIHDMHDEDGNFIGGHQPLSIESKIITRPPQKYGLQLIEAPPCSFVQFNKRGKRRASNVSTEINYASIDALGIFPSNRKPNVTKSTGENGNVGETKRDASGSDGGMPTDVATTKLNKNKRQFPVPGSINIPTDESNLLWRRCVTGAAVIMYNVKNDESFQIAKQLLAAATANEGKRKEAGYRGIPVLFIAK